VHLWEGGKQEMSNGKYTLTLLDTSGIQDYIFSSNRLQENIGASELVYRATTLWVFQALEEAGSKQHNIQDAGTLDWSFDESRHMEKDPTLQAEVIQAAGGNTLILFREKSHAIDFVKTLTLRLLKEAPGLTLLAKHQVDFDYESQKITDVRDELIKAMNRHKLSGLCSTATLGLSVTAVCSSTGLPAVRTPMGTQKIGKDEIRLLIPGQDEEEAERSRLISRETTFKLAARDLANERLRHTIGEVAQWYDFPSDIDNLGRVSGEESYVAVVHVDGNGMGQHVHNIAERVEKEFGKEDVLRFNREYILALRQFSGKIERTSRRTLVHIVEKLVASIDAEDMVAGRVPVVKVSTESHKYNYIPFRPLVFGGDDVTFLCNGQLGVELATLYLEAFEKFTSQEELNFHACAGVSIVKMHYPFSRAYKLAEELIHSAKMLVQNTGWDFSALDWHFAQSGLSGSLKVIRGNEFSSKDGRPLTIRPLSLHQEADPDIRSWDEVKSVLQAFSQEPWSESHNKVLGLREPLRKDGEAVRQYRLNFGLEKLPVFAEAAETGWFKNRCAYFDVIELLDHHVGLEPVKEGVK
jgi:hypothetical protein